MSTRLNYCERTTAFIDLEHALFLSTPSSPNTPAFLAETSSSQLSIAPRPNPPKPYLPFVLSQPFPPSHTKSDTSTAVSSFISSRNLPKSHSPKSFSPSSFQKKGQQFSVRTQEGKLKGTEVKVNIIKEMMDKKMFGVIVRTVGRNFGLNLPRTSELRLRSSRRNWWIGMRGKVLRLKMREMGIGWFGVL